MKTRKILILLAFLLALVPSRAQTRGEDKVKLEHAIEYFNNGKYHEALLLFRDLSTRHTLGERMTAQRALCEYYDWNFKEAAVLFDSIMPALEPYAPHERSLYRFAAAESHFNLQQYEKAAPHYLSVLQLCYPDERAQVHYRLGFCFMFLNDELQAGEHFSKALEYFQTMPKTGERKAKISQLKRMIRGLKGRK